MIKAKLLFSICSAVLFFCGCYKYKGVKGFVSDYIEYPTKFYTVEIEGKRWVSDGLLIDESTYPLTCAIESVRTEDGKDASFIQKPVITKHWKKPYTGNEKNVQEMMNLYDTVMRPALDIDSLSGALIIYEEADRTIIPPGKYIIDVRVTGPGGTSVIKNAMTVTIKLSKGYFYKLDNFYGLNSMETKFTKKGPGNKLTVFYHGPNSTIIDPKEFIGPYGDLRLTFENPYPPNPLSYNALPDRIELELTYPYPLFGNAQLILLNEGSINGEYLDFTFDMAIYQSADWQLDIYLDW